jgi:hypothetical protein
MQTGRLFYLFYMLENELPSSLRLEERHTAKPQKLCVLYLEDRPGGASGRRRKCDIAATHHFESLESMVVRLIRQQLPLFLAC